MDVNSKHVNLNPIALSRDFLNP